MFLTDGELIELTGKQKRPAQIRVLRQLCIEHRIRPDGRPMVLRAHVDVLFGAGPQSAKVEEAEPDWSAM